MEEKKENEAPDTIFLAKEAKPEVVSTEPVKPETAAAPQQTQVAPVNPEQTESIPKKSKKLFYIFVAIVIGLILGGGGYIVKSRSDADKAAKKEQEAAKAASEKKVTKAPTPTPSGPKVITGSNSLDAYKGWKSYYDSTYDVTFKYPAAWNVTESPFVLDKVGDKVASYYNIDDNCKNLKVCGVNGYSLAIGLKDINDVRKTVPIIEIEAPIQPRDPKCDECEEVTVEFKIRGVKHTYTIFKDKEEDNYYSLGRSLTGISTGYKSNWKKMNISFRSGDKKTLEDFINTVNSIQ